MRPATVRLAGKLATAMIGPPSCFFGMEWRTSMFVGCSTLCFARYPLDRALRIIGELEFGKLDVAIHERGPHLKPSQVVEDVGLAAQLIRIGPSLTPGAFSVEIRATSAEYQHQLRAVCRLARLSTVSIITIPAGPSG